MNRTSALTLRLVAAFAAVVIVATALAVTTRCAVASPQLLYDNPQRPADSRQLLATTGTVLRYELIVSDRLIAPRLTIRDDITGTETTFSLSFDTSIDGQRLSCAGDRTANPGSSPASIIAHYLGTLVEQYHLCTSLPPNIIVGQTRVVLIYWRHVEHDPPSPFYDFNQNPGSDAIWVTR